jgi:XTP/dITP diphosphohydrolase
MLTFQTTNAHKFREAREILSRRGIEIRHLNAPTKEIQAETLEEVVQEALRGLPPYTMIEDSGLFIRALRGFPGVYSQYVQKTLGNSGILTLLERTEDRRAEFRSVVGLLLPGKEGAPPVQRLFRGTVRGEIAREIRGKAGFGYDPIFLPEGGERTFGEDARLKSEVSHRRAALEALADWLGGRRDG